MLHIRRYQTSDYDQVWVLHKLALEKVGAYLGNGPWNDDLNNVEAAYLNSGGEFLVGACKGRIIAMGALKRISNDQAEIKRMRVHPDFQRRGFGQRILRCLESRAVELEYKTLYLDTMPQQFAAQKLYVKSGYIEMGRSKVGRFNMIFYKKDLKT